MLYIQQKDVVFKKKIESKYLVYYLLVIHMY